MNKNVKKDNEAMIIFIEKQWSDETASMSRSETFALDKETVDKYKKGERCDVMGVTGWGNFITFAPVESLIGLTKDDLIERGWL